MFCVRCSEQMAFDTMTGWVGVSSAAYRLSKIIEILVFCSMGGRCLAKKAGDKGAR